MGDGSWDEGARTNGKSPQRRGGRGEFVGLKDAGYSVQSLRLPTAACRLPPAACRLPTACHLPTADRRLPTADCRLPTAACRLPPAACRLPTAACHLPTAACRLLSPGSRYGTIAGLPATSAGKRKPSVMNTSLAHPARTLLLACGVFLAAGTVLSGIGPALPALAARSGQNVAALGALFTALSAGVVLTQLVVGRASDRWGLPVVLAAGMALMALGALLLALGASLLALLLAALVAGMGFGGVIAAGNVLVARLFPARSAAALNGANVFFGVGSIVGPLLAGIAGARLGVPYAALVLGAAALLLLAPLIGRRPPPPTIVGAGAEGDAGRGAGTLWLFGVVLLIYTGTEVGLGGWITVYLIASAGLAPEMAALGASGFWLGLTSGRALGAALGLRLAPPNLLLLSLVAVLLGALALAAGLGRPLASLASIVLLGLACGPVFPTVLAVIAGATGGSNRAAAHVLTLGNGGGLILPALLGVLLGRYGPGAMVGVVLVAALAMLTICGVAVLLLRAPAARGMGNGR